MATAASKGVEIPVEITYPSEEKEPQVVATIPPAIPTPTTFVGTVPEPPAPKEQAAPVDIEAFKKRFEQMQKELERLTMVQKKTEDLPKKEIKPLETVKFFLESPFVLLPMLSAVAHPMYIGRQDAFAVGVGSRDWLHALDEMRAAGWQYYGEYGIEMFLLKSAWIVKQELNYNVIRVGREGETDPNRWSFLEMDKFAGNFDNFKKDILSRKYKYVNNVEKFSMGYPDEGRQRERLEKGYGRLIKDIRQKLGVQAFLPQNYDTRKEGEALKCPPKDNTFFVGDLQVTGFLQNWTEYDTTQPIYVPVGNTVIQVFECRPPRVQEFAWIPLKYRKDIEEKYNLVQFKYNSGHFQKFLYTLLQHDQLEEPLRTYDEQGRAFISIQGPGKMGYKMFLAKLNLNYSVYEKRTGVPEGELTMREWMEEYVSDLALYPLLQAILNAPAPGNEGTPESPGIYKSYVYHTPGSGGKRLKKMYADAPVRVFKHQLVQATVGKVRPGETYGDCMERFIKGMYQFIYQKWAPKIENFPTEVPERYRQILASLFDYGGQPQQCISTMTALSTPTPTTPATAPPTAPTTREMEGKSEKDLKAMIADILSHVKQLA